MNKYVKFQFNSAIYRQSGVAMGSLLYPIMANIFMGYLETQSLNKRLAKRWNTPDMLMTHCLQQ